MLECKKVTHSTGVIYLLDFYINSIFSEYMLGVKYMLTIVFILDIFVTIRDNTCFKYGKHKYLVALSVCKQ
jgi:hypothetical protein